MKQILQLLTMLGVVVGLAFAQVAATDEDIAEVPWPEQRPVLPLLTAARLIGMSRNQAYYLAKTGRFPIDVIELGGRKAVLTTDLRRFFGLPADKSAK
jgi:hypothetical protein